MKNGNHNTPYQDKIAGMYSKLDDAMRKRGHKGDKTILQLFSSEYQRG